MTDVVDTPPVDAPPVDTAPPVNATPGAIDLAKELGVDLSKVEGSGFEGRITKTDVDAYAQTGKPAPLYYCLSNDHSWFPKDETRFFGYEGGGCPTCPTCGKQVTAVPVNALGEYPAVVSNLTGGG